MQARAKERMMRATWGPNFFDPLPVTATATSIHLAKAAAVAITRSLITGELSSPSAASKFRSSELITLAAAGAPSSRRVRVERQDVVSAAALTRAWCSASPGAAISASACATACRATSNIASTRLTAMVAMSASWKREEEESVGSSGVARAFPAADVAP